MRRGTWVWLIVGLALVGLGGCPSPTAPDATNSESLNPSSDTDHTGAGRPATPVHPEEEPTGSQGDHWTPPPERLPNPDSEPTSGGGSGSGGSSGSTATGGTEEPQTNPTPPTDPVGTAVDQVAVQLLVACRALAAPAALADARLVLNAYTAGEFGYCPTIRWACDSLWSLVAVDFEYTGCSSAATAGLAFAGNLGMYIARDTGWAEMEYCSFSINKKAVTGHIQASLIEMPQGVNVLGSCWAKTAGVGKVSGDLDLDCREQGWYLFSANELMLTAGEWSNAVALEDLRVDPLGNQSFVPSSGKATFSIANPVPPPEELNIAVQFTNQSPVDGTVLVSVNGAPAFEHRIPITVP